MLATLIVCSCQGDNEVKVPIVDLNDSIMMANGYNVVELHKMKTGHITAILNHWGNEIMRQA